MFYNFVIIYYGVLQYVWSQREKKMSSMQDKNDLLGLKLIAVQRF